MTIGRGLDFTLRLAADDAQLCSHDDAGRMTHVMEQRDGPTDQILARVVDRLAGKER